jgi:hypothetical protein
VAAFDLNRKQAASALAVVAEDLDNAVYAKVVFGHFTKEPSESIVHRGLDQAAPLISKDRFIGVFRIFSFRHVPLYLLRLDIYSH